MNNKLIIQKFNSLFQNKLLLTTLIFLLLFYIIFYNFININTKKEIYNSLSNPLVILFLVILILLVLYNNFTVGLLLLFSLILSLSIGERKKNNNKSKEGFNNNKTFLETSLRKFNKTIQNKLENNKKKLDNKYKNKYKKNKESFNENNNKIVIKKREFDMNNQEDKNLLYSKEVLKEIINRIKYEYDDKEYLKKYITSKFEEIVDVLDLLNDD